MQGKSLCWNRAASKKYYYWRGFFLTRFHVLSVILFIESKERWLTTIIEVILSRKNVFLLENLMVFFFKATISSLKIRQTLFPLLNLDKVWELILMCLWQSWICSQMVGRNESQEMLMGNYLSLLNLLSWFP